MTDDPETDDHEIPLDELARNLEDPDADPGDSFEGTGFQGASDTSSFTEMDVEDVDAAAVWADLETGGEEPVVIAERQSSPGERDVRIIPKRTCHTCPYFGEPPEVHCTHEGTDIRRAVGVDEFEVVDCPMVLAEEDFE